MLTPTEVRLLEDVVDRLNEVDAFVNHWAREDYHSCFVDDGMQFAVRELIRKNTQC